MGRATASQGEKEFTARPQPTARQWAFAAVSMPALLLGIWMLPPDLPGRWAFVCVVWFLLVLLFLIIPLHEAGHVVAGGLVGFRFERVNLGPLRVAREGQRIRVRVQQSGSGPMGMARCAPTGHRNLRPRLAVYIAGGPIASLLAGAAGVLLFVHLRCRWDIWSAQAAHQIWLSAPLLAVSVLCLLEFIFELMAGFIPKNYGGHPSDAEWLRVLLRGGPGAERCCALISLEGRIMDGVRPRDWPPHLVEVAAGADGDGSVFDIFGKVCGYYRLLDGGDVAGAEELLYRALELSHRHPGGAHMIVCVEAAYFCARHQGGKSAAWDYLQRATKRGGPSISPHAGRRAIAALLLAMGNFDEARQKAHEALRAIDPAGGSGIDLAEADWLREIITLCDSAAPSTPSVPEAADRGMANIRKEAP